MYSEHSDRESSEIGTLSTVDNSWDPKILVSYSVAIQFEPPRIGQPLYKGHVQNM